MSGRTRRWPRRVPLPSSAGLRGGSGRAASRTASARASRSSPVGPESSTSISCRTTSQPRGTVSRSAWNSQRSRSEEHTSELQSRQYLVCRLLLEKKKNKKYINEYKSRDRKLNHI